MLNNKALDIDYMSLISPEYTFMAKLAKALRDVGYECMTTDVFLKNRPSEKALLLSYSGWGYWLKRKEFVPALCFCLESPIVVWYFYRMLPLLANRFHHLFLWPGCSTRTVDTSAKINDIFWPNSLQQNFQHKPWAQRKFLVMINSNKRAFQPNWDLMKLRTPLKTLAWGAYYVAGQAVKHTDPWMDSELYLERLQAIDFFSGNSGFDLFGRGWDKPIPGHEALLRQAVNKSYRGLVPPGELSKLKVLGNYKFSLCFENTSFPGYITEKVFDCFFTGTIPIYLGAPDITDHVPSDTFVDFRKFRSYDELNKYIVSMTEKEAQAFLDTARNFVSSASFSKFRSSTLIQSMIDAINDVADNYEL